MSNYFPFGFTYPDGFPYNDTNPDPAIEAVRHRIEFLNSCHEMTIRPDGSLMPGHIFAAAMDLFQKGSNMDVASLWTRIEATLTPEEVADIAEALFPKVKDTLPLLDFPNAIALFDCRFVSTAEWEHIRRYSIGGSEAATVLGLSHFQSRRSLFHEKKTVTTNVHDVGTQQIFDYGHAVEDYTVAAVADTLGGKRYPEYRMFAHKKYPFITCNPDGILVFPDGHFALFEAKTATRWKLDDWRNDIPDYYVPQPRQYLEVLDDPRLTEGYIGCCFGGLPCDMKVHKYFRDAAAGAAQIDLIVEFWFDHIVPGVLPDFCGDPELDMEAEYRYVQRMTLTSTDTLPGGCAADFARYYDLQAQHYALTQDINKAKEEEEKYLEMIKPSAADGLTICTVPGGMTYRIKCSPCTRETVDAHVLPDYLKEWLLSRAELLRSQGISYSFPKVSKAIKKASTRSKKKTT